MSADETLARLMALFSRELPAVPPPPEPQPPAPIILPDLPATPAPPPAPPRERARIYSPKRRGYMRATREEGVGDEIARMNDEARGSPFFGDTRSPRRAPPEDRPASAAAPWARRGGGIERAAPHEVEADEKAERRHRDARKRPDHTQE